MKIEEKINITISSKLNKISIEKKEDEYQIFISSAFLDIEKAKDLILVLQRAIEVMETKK